VLTKTLGAFLGGVAARRAKTKDGFCPILMYDLYTAVLRAVLPCTYVQDVRYAGFAGAKAGHAKTLIIRGTLL